MSYEAKVVIVWVAALAAVLLLRVVLG